MTRTIFITAGVALAITLPVVSAQAQSPRTFVSAAGTDNSTCSFAAPCRHFQNAVNVTSAGGEVDALDPAGYGPITINHAITIEGQGWSYIAPPIGGNAITINADTMDKVSIHGVSLNGVGIAGGTTGILFNSGGSLTVRDCVIRNFFNNGIGFEPNGVASTKLLVSNTAILDNTLNGIEIMTPGSTVSAVLDQIEVANTSEGNGVITFSGGGGIIVMVRNSTIINNLNSGLFADNSSTIRVTRSTITGNGSGWGVNNSGVISSYGDNNIDGNAQNNSTPPNSLVYH
jgi:hypothetical protein